VVEAERATATTDRDLVITRVFDAPRELVFQAWVDPAQFARWWGPEGFSAPVAELDAVPGGAWRSCIRRAADGLDIWSSGIYREIVPPERLVFTFAWDREGGGRGHETLVTVTFAEQQGGKTRMTFRQAVFESVEQRDGHQGGWNSAFDRLAEHVTRAEGPA
jgi:uncharacterized protein YndB with AHSA1/START domain